MRRELFGEWDFPPEEPSPGPWRVKFFAARPSVGADENAYVVLDANGKWVAECARAVDANMIAAMRGLAESKGV